MIQSLVLFHGIEVDALYLVLENIFKKAGRVSTKMLCDYCMFGDEFDGKDDTGWTSIDAFKFCYTEPGVYEIKIEDPVLIEPIKWEDLERGRLEWMTSEISQ